MIVMKTDRHRRYLFVFTFRNGIQIVVQAKGDGNGQEKFSDRLKKPTKCKLKMFTFTFRRKWRFRVENVLSVWFKQFYKSDEIIHISTSPHLHIVFIYSIYGKIDFLSWFLFIFRKTSFYFIECKQVFVRICVIAF